jgi:hypothetical protein
VVGTEEPLLGVVFDVPACTWNGASLGRRPEADAGQAQGSTGPEALETASRQRVRLEEQGLEAPALRRDGIVRSRVTAAGVSVGRRGEGREGKARGVRGGPAMVRRGDAGPHRREPVPLPAGERLRRAERHAGESSFVAGGNGVNPMADSALQQSRGVRKEETVEVVRNHEGGTRGEMASRLRWRSGSGSSRRCAPGVDFRARDSAEGRLWKSQERKIRPGGRVD